jgi:hypothetical protein
MTSPIIRKQMRALLAPDEMHASLSFIWSGAAGAAEVASASIQSSSTPSSANISQPKYDVDMCDIGGRISTPVPSFLLSSSPPLLLLPLTLFLPSRLVSCSLLSCFNRFFSPSFRHSFPSSFHLLHKWDMQVSTSQILFFEACTGVSSGTPMILRRSWNGPNGLESPG